VPRRSILSVAERESLMSLPASQDDLIRHYSLNESDLSLIRQRRGASNRLGFAILLSYMRYPGIILGVGDEAYAPLLSYVAQQVNVDAEAWKRYGQREQTRREHLLELQEVFGFKPFTGGHYRSAVAQLADVAFRRIAETINRAQPAVYQHFESKDAILAAVVVEGFTALFERLKRAARGEKAAPMTR
jgi:TnpA family transposase